MEKTRMMKFGDITISNITTRDVTDEIAGELVMMKEGRSFFYAKRNKLGEVTDLALADGNDHIIFTMKASQESGKWESANYGPSENGRPTGDLYMDIDFDGRFDMKLSFDHNGKLRDRYISYYRTWKQVDRFENQTAFSESNTFTFRKDLGWQLDSKGNGETYENMSDLLDDH
jgi:hypothetical protein